MKLQKETNLHGRWYDDACGTAFALELVGERWSLLIIRELMLGPRRFSDLRATLPGISAKVLTERLATLANAQARRRIQQALEGLSVDAEMKALETVREHIARISTEGRLDHELLAPEGHLLTP